MDAKSHPPKIILTDITELATITANMIHSFLKQENIIRLKKHEQQNSTLPQRKISLRLPKTINNGTSTPKPGKYRTPICTQRSGRMLGMAQYQVIVLDNDLGQSGASSNNREDFKTL